MVAEHSTQTTLPVDDLKPAWRAACVAYRNVRQSGQLDHPAWLAARAAVHDLRPDLDEKTAGMQASAAINYASVVLRRGFGIASAIRGAGNDDAARESPNDLRLGALAGSAG